MKIINHLRYCLIKFSCFFVGVDVSSHVFPGHTSKEVGPRNCSDPGETVVEDVFENTETLVNSEKSVIEIDFDEVEEELTSIYWRPFVC